MHEYHRHTNKNGIRTNDELYNNICKIIVDNFNKVEDGYYLESVVNINKDSVEVENRTCKRSLYEYFSYRPASVFLGSNNKTLCDIVCNSLRSNYNIRVKIIDTPIKRPKSWRIIE